MALFRLVIIESFVLLSSALHKAPKRWLQAYPKNRRIKTLIEILLKIRKIMGLFNFFKSSKSKKANPIFNSIGKFSFTEFDGTKNFKGNVNSIIGENIELLFPINKKEISTYQIDYFKKIENNWNSILLQLRNMNPKIDFENYKVSNIVIPDNGNEFYDMNAEIVFKKNRKFISAILTSLNIEEIIEN